MDLSTLIKTRRSVRTYKRRKVPRKLLNKILDSARWAPSLHNMQPWKFIIPEGRIKKRLLEALKRSQGSEALLVRLTLKDSIKAIEKAPVIILAYNNGVLSNKVKKGGNSYLGYLDKATMFEMQSVACAMQNMLLTAHSLGLGAAWFGIPIFSEKPINKLLGTDYKLMAILTVGYPGKRPNAPPRKPLSEIVSFVR